MASTDNVRSQGDLIEVPFGGRIMARRNVFILAVVLGVLTVSLAHAAPVTWTFYETSCSEGSFGANKCSPIPITAPVAVGTLTLPGPDSVGSAEYGQALPPTQTGDGDNFSLFFGFPLESLTGLVLTPPTNLALQTTSFYLVNWSEAGGVLTDILVNYATSLNSPFSGGADVGLFGGQVGSDGDVGTCSQGACIFGGVWSTTIPSIPEPSSVTLLGAALGFFALLPLFSRARLPALVGARVI